MTINEFMLGDMEHLRTLHWECVGTWSTHPHELMRFQGVPDSRQQAGVRSSAADTQPHQLPTCRQLLGTLCQPHGICS